MSAALYAVGCFCVRRRHAVLATWLALVVGFVVVTGMVGEPTANNLSLPGSDSTRAQDVLENDLPQQANGTNPVVIEAPRGTLRTASNRRAIAATVRSLEKSPYVQSAISPFSPQGAGTISNDGRIAYISVGLTVGPSDIDEDEAHAVVDAEAPAR